VTTKQKIDMEWIEQGACRDQPTINFFAENTSARGRLEQKAAISLCQNCPVLYSCREYALKYERFGVWGGLTEIQRTKERRRLKIKPELDRFNMQMFLPRANRPDNKVKGNMGERHQF